MSSIFVDDSLEREHEEYGKWVFSEPKPKQVMLLPKCFDMTISEIQQQAKEAKKNDDESKMDFNLDDLNLDIVYDLLADMIQEWPADKELNKENLEQVKLNCLGWLMQEAFEIVNDQGKVKEAEVKNSKGS